MLQKTFNVLSSLLFSDNHTMYSDEEEEEEEEEEAEEEFAEVKHWNKKSNMDSYINVQMIELIWKKRIRRILWCLRFHLSFTGCVMHW